MHFRLTSRWKGECDITLPIYIAPPFAIYVFLVHDVDSATFPLTFILADERGVTNDRTKKLVSRIYR